MRPEVIAKISNKVQYPNANAASTPIGWIAKETKADPGRLSDG